MNNPSLILSILLMLIYNSSQSWASPPCPFSGYFHNCFGTFVTPEGDKYEGEFKNNTYHGQGAYTFSNGNKYEGEFKNGKYYGFGIVTFSTGSKYEGEFKNGKYNGQGTFTFVNGNKYVGEYKDNKRHGLGTYTYANGDKHKGEYKNGKMNGFGIYTYGHNTKWAGYKYEGEFKDGKRHGQGTFIFANGLKQVGKFENDFLNGFGISYDKDGTILNEGIWKDGKFLYTQKKSIPNSNSKLDKYKRFCETIGFNLGTEKFAECVLEAMKKG